ncbi:NAD-P-binding protein [Trametes maxima]|nr:NAD-P-binding protein [Trametes maxima]
MTIFYAIAGASRGIGLEFVRQLAAKKNTVVFAIVRSKQNSTHLVAVAASLKNVHVVEGDVGDHKSIARAAAEISSLSGGKLDYLINNAAKTDSAIFKGYNDYKNLDELDSDFIGAYNVNVLGVIHSICAFLPLLRAGSSKGIIVIGSDAGKTDLARAMGYANMTAYCITKAATEMATTKWALTLKDEGFVVVTMHPGAVDVSETSSKEYLAVARPMLSALIEDLKAAAGTEGLQFLTPEQSVKAQLEVIDKLQPSDSGAFVTYDGKKD